jgi:dihydrofolate reductase
MRRLRYGVAVSLDGFIAGPHGEYDWIVRDPAIDFAAIYAQFDTFLMGRKTYEVAKPMRQDRGGDSTRWVVVSTTLDPALEPGITVISTGVAQAVAGLKAEPGPEPRKDIWLFGGGVLFRSLLDAGLVDALDLMVIPVLLGAGIPLLPEGRRAPLHLKESQALASGILQLKYDVLPDSPA